MNLADNIKKMRRIKNMKQSDLSERLHVSNKTVSSWECGRTEPRMGMIEKMCEVFQCGKNELIDGDSDAQIIIGKISGKLSAMDKPKTSFIDDIQRDPAFMSNIRALFSLPEDQRAVIYGHIQYLYYDAEQKKTGSRA